MIEAGVHHVPVRHPIATFRDKDNQSVHGKHIPGSSNVAICSSSPSLLLLSCKYLTTVLPRDLCFPLLQDSEVVNPREDVELNSSYK